MSSPPNEPDHELTPEEIEGIRLAMEEADRGEGIPLEQVHEQLMAELEALERVRRRAG